MLAAFSPFCLRKHKETGKTIGTGNWPVFSLLLRVFHFYPQLMDISYFSNLLVLQKEVRFMTFSFMKFLYTGYTIPSSISFNKIKSIDTIFIIVIILLTITIKIVVCSLHGIRSGPPSSSPELSDTHLSCHSVSALVGHPTKKNLDLYFDHNANPTGPFFNIHSQ